MAARRSVFVWFAAGVLLASYLQFVQVRALGGDADALLSVGEGSAVRSVIEAELGEVTLVPGHGHDGQTAFVVAVDPLARQDGGTLLDDQGFRYRRIGFPVLGGGFGLFGGHQTLWGLIVVGAAAFGLAAAATAWSAGALGLDQRVAAAALLTPGMWLAVQLTTVDTLAVGMALVGVGGWLWGRYGWATVALAVATLTKEQMLLVALSLTAYELAKRRPRRAGLALAPSLGGLAVWSGLVTLFADNGFTARGNLTFPMTGILDAAAVWPTAPRSDVILAWVTLAVLATAAVVAWQLRTEPLGWIIGPWPLLGAISSSWVWDFGNNVARVFAVVVPLTALGIGRLVQRGRAPAPSRPIDG